MVPADAAPQEQRLADTPADGTAISVGQLAHELNSLLDGSLRTLGLALRQLEPTRGDRRSAEAVVARLQTARDAMWQMAELLERAMRGGEATSQVLCRARPLGEEVPRILALVHPLADAHDVALKAEIGPEAGELPIGPLGAVLLNGLRNAVQACVRRDGGPMRVELSAAVERGRLVVLISDTGSARDSRQTGGARPGPGAVPAGRLGNRGATGAGAG
ncbi:MAG: sensor histidine kinase [Planctomycetota bacterium]|jgi:C4-dicarboxylate-specific signal transduction histidine kinase